MDTKIMKPSDQTMKIMNVSEPVRFVHEWREDQDVDARARTRRARAAWAMRMKNMNPEESG